MDPPGVMLMDRSVEDLLDRAYRRRAELMALPEPGWVRMHLEANGITLVRESANGDIHTEVFRHDADPGDGGAGNGAYDRE